MKYFFSLLILASLGLCGCKIGTSTIFRDDNIKQELINEIHSIDDIVVHAVVSKDSVLLKSIMSEGLLKHLGDNTNELIEQASKFIINTDYKILNQFYSKNSTKDRSNTFFSGTDELNDYFISLKAVNEEIFVSLIVLQDDFNEYLITNVYGKHPERWKLNILQFGHYKISGKTAPELYLKAKSNYDNGYLLDAVNNMVLCSKVVSPGNEIWLYKNKKQMSALYDLVDKEINIKHPLPLILDSISSSPQIISIYPQFTQEGYFPRIEYLTAVNIEDTIKTKVENDKIHNQLINIFKGLDKDKKYILYTAYNEIPSGIKYVPSYGFVKKLK